MTPRKVATKQTTIRLRPEDHKHIETIIKSGAARDMSEAIRVALALFGRFTPKA